MILILGKKRSSPSKKGVYMISEEKNVKRKQRFSVLDKILILVLLIVVAVVFKSEFTGFVAQVLKIAGNF